MNGVRSGSVRAAVYNKNNLQQIKITPKRIINLNNPLAVDAQQQPHPLWQPPLSLLPLPPPLFTLFHMQRAFILDEGGNAFTTRGRVKCCQRD